MKALRNFSCNGVRKKIGQEISDEDREKIGDLLDKLIRDDFIQAGGAEVKKVVEDVVNKSDDDLNGMDLPSLVQYAKDLGLNPHHRSGEDKVRELIREKLNRPEKN